MTRHQTSSGYALGLLVKDVLIGVISNEIRNDDLGLTDAEWWELGKRGL